MPGAIIGAVAASVGSATAAVVTGTAISTAFSVGSIATSFFSSLAVGAIGQALQKKPKLPDFKSQAQGFSTMVKEPASSANIVYGRTRASGSMVFVHTTDQNKWLHLVVTLAPHEVESIDTIFFNDDVIMIDSSGDTTDSRFLDDDGTPLITIKKHLGTDSQTVDTELKSYAPNVWTSQHRLRGIAYIYVRLGWKEGLWPNGIPNISALVKGKKLYDTRDTTTAYSTNTALAAYDYLTNSEYGLNVPTSEIDTDSFDTAANVCDESVSVTAVKVQEYPARITASSESADSHSLESILDTNDSTSWWADTNTNEYVTWKLDDAADVIQMKLQAPSRQGDSSQAPTSWNLKASNTGSFSGEEVTIETQSSQSWSDGEEKTYNFTNGTSYLYYRLTMTTTNNERIGLNAMSLFSEVSSENRYTVNGPVDTAQTPKAILEAVTQTMAGFVVYQNGKWFCYAGEYRTPTVSISESEIIGPIKVETMVSRRELFNTVKAIYIDPGQGYQPVDMPEVTNATYVSEDNGDTLTHDTNFPLVTSGATAQRLSKILLESVRQQIRVTLKLNMNGFQLQVGDNFQLSNTRFGWTNKVFQVDEWSFALEQGPNGALAPYVNVMARETASSVYSWSTEETTVDPAPNTSLPNPFEVTRPEDFVFTTGDDYLYIKADGSVASFARLTWTKSTDRFVLQGGKFEIDAKLTAIPDRTTSTVALDQWFRVAEVDGSASSTNLFNLQDGGTYSFRIRSVNSAAKKSSYNTLMGKVMAAKAAPPSNVRKFYVSQVGDQLSFRWESISDVDLAEYEIRYGPESDTSWKDATPLATSRTNNATVAALPGDWSYFIKAKDTIGNYSQVARIATVSVVNVNNVIKSLIDTDFTAGTVTNMVQHYSGALTAQDQNLASDYGWSTFDLFIPNPVESGSYITSDLDIDFDDTVRVWGTIQSELGPGVGTGVAEPEFNILYLLDGQSGQLANQDTDSIDDNGTLTNMVLDYRGNLIPKSQNLASDDGFSTFDVFVPNPFTSCSYEAAEVDVGADRSLVFSVDVDEELGPGETGSLDALTSVDYRTSVDAYDGFEEWTSGRIEAQYIKHKVSVNTGNGVTVIRRFFRNIDGFEPWTIGNKTGRLFTGRIDADYSLGNYVIRQLDFVTDKADVFQEAQDVAIGASGTTITFDSEYHTTPRIKVDPQGTTAVSYAVSNKSGTGFHVKLFNSSGTAISGTIDWEARGA
jgi:hypothetical protein